MSDVDVLVVGAGPAGLEAARCLGELGRLRVLVLDREREAGGVPRHCHHPGFGWLDLRRLHSGPRYAQRRVELARQAGVEIRVETTALSWTGPTSVATTSPSGLDEVHARAVLLATGCRERPRSARLVPGTRPQGVLTTGSLQQLVHERGIAPGHRAVVVGAEHVSFSAVHTLVGAGATVLAMVTEHARHQSFEPLRWATAWWYDVPILTSSEVTRIDGQRRVESIELTNRITGERQRLACDTVVFTGDFVPDHELARLGHLELDLGTRGPAVDGELRTSRPGVFAAGNLLHAAETADVAALDGRHAAACIARFLAGHSSWDGVRPAILVEPPLRWIHPNRVAPRHPPRDCFVLRPSSFRARGDIEVRQAGKTLFRQPFRDAVPHRPLHLDADWLARVRLDGGPVRVMLS